MRGVKQYPPFVRHCPSCHKELVYANTKQLWKAKRYNTKCSHWCGVPRIPRPTGNGEYKRQCPKCGREVVHNWIITHKRTQRRTIICRSCATKTAWQTPHIRKQYYDALERTQWLKVRCDIGQLEFVKKWNNLGFRFTINYTLKGDDYIYYLDGYDKEHNVVLEYDGNYHNSGPQKEKDLIRQNKIMSILKPKRFWRYNTRTRSVSEVTHNNAVNN